MTQIVARGKPHGGASKAARAVASAASAESAARYHAASGPWKKQRVHPAYVTDGIAVDRAQRRILLDLSPVTVEALLTATRGGSIALVERLLVEALEKAR